MTRGENTHPLEQEELMAYLDGELVMDRAVAVAEHLGHCQECQRLAADLQRVSRRLMAWQIPVNDVPVSRWMAATLLEKPAEERTGFPPRRPGVRRWVPWMLGFAGLLIIGLVAMIPRMYGPHYATATSQYFSIDGQPEADVVKPQKLQQFANLQQAPGEPMLERVAQLTLTTSEFAKINPALEDILKRHHGYPGQTTINSPTGGARTLTATLQVPADQLDAVLSEVRQLGRVQAESQSGQDVARPYVDLQARLVNARNTEQRLTDMLKQRTGKLSDVLAVETEIDRTRGEIERMEAERKSMTDRVAFATLNVRITEEYKAPLQGVSDTTATQFRNAAVEGYRSMIGGLVDLGLLLVSYGPSLLLWAGLLFFPARFAWKRWRKAA